MCSLDDRCGYRLIDATDPPSFLKVTSIGATATSPRPVALRLAVRAKFDCRHIYGFVEGDRRDAQPALG